MSGEADGAAFVSVLRLAVAGPDSSGGSGAGGDG